MKHVVAIVSATLTVWALGVVGAAVGAAIGKGVAALIRTLANRV